MSLRPWALSVDGEERKGHGQGGTGDQEAASGQLDPAGTRLQWPVHGFVVTYPAARRWSTPGSSYDPSGVSAGHPPEDS